METSDILLHGLTSAGVTCLRTSRRKSPTDTRQIASSCIDCPCQGRGPFWVLWERTVSASQLLSRCKSPEAVGVFDMLSKKDTPRNARLFGWDRLLTDSACQPLWEAQTKSGQIR